MKGLKNNVEFRGSIPQGFLSSHTVYRPGHTCNFFWVTPLGLGNDRCPPQSWFIILIQKGEIGGESGRAQVLFSGGRNVTVSRCIHP